MATITTNTPNEQLWEANRGLIVSLYLDAIDANGQRVPVDKATNKALESGLSLDNVKTHMEKFHNFCASKFCYEQKFKLWNIRKNLGRPEWQALGHIVEALKAKKRPFEVYMSDRLIPQKRLYRQVRRYRSGRLNDAKLPWGIEIRYLSTKSTMTHDLNNIGIFSSTLAVTTAETSIPSFPASPQLIQEEGYGDLPDLNRLVPILDKQYQSGDTQSANALLETEYLDRATMFDLTTSEQQNRFGSDTIKSSSENQTSQITKPSIRPYSVARKSFGRSSEIQSQRYEFESINRSLLFGNLLQKVTYPDFLKCLVYNNCAQSDALSALKAPSNHEVSHLTSILGKSALLSQAFCENLFRIAIELGKTDLVKFLLCIPGRHFDLNTFVCVSHPTNVRCTALERASELCHAELVVFLISVGADCNLTYSRTGPLVRALCPNQSSLCVTFTRKKQTILAILEGKSRITSEAFGRAVELADADILVKIISKPSATQFLTSVFSAHSREVGKWASIVCEAGHDNELSSLFNDLLKRITTAKPINKDGKTVSQFLERMNDTAARFDHSQLLKTCLAYGSYGLSNALITSIRHQHIRITELILNHDANLDFHYVRKVEEPWLPDIAESIPNLYLYTTPFAEAIRRRDYNLYKHMIEKDTLSNIQNEQSFEAALTAASEVGDIDIVRDLISKRGFEQDRINANAALCIAILYEQPKLISLFLEVRAKFKWRGASVVAAAIYKRDSELVNKLLYIGAIPSFIRWTSLFDWGNLQLIDSLLDAGYQWSKNDTPYRICSCLEEKASLHYAIRLLKYLLKRGILIDESNLISVALRFDSLELMELVLSHGAKLTDSRGFFKATKMAPKCLAFWIEGIRKAYPSGIRNFGVLALRRAIKILDLDLLRDILPVVDIHGIEYPLSSYMPKCEINGFLEGISPFGEAITFDSGIHIDIVRKIISAGADIDKIVTDRVPYFLSDKPEKLETPLMAAIRSTNLDMVHLIIESGADVNRAPTFGLRWTPLQYAAKLGSYDIVQYLLEKGAEFNAEPAFRSGGTALQCAAEAGWNGIAELLLKRGADVNAAGSVSLGRTALQFAAEKGRFLTVRYLLRKGADHKQIPEAVKLAKKYGHFALAKFLLQQDKS